MSKKDYIAFATIFGEAANLEQAIDMACEHFERDNRLFDERRFRDWIVKVATEVA